MVYGTFIAAFHEYGSGSLPLVESTGLAQRELRALVAAGSDSPPDCHSVPALFEPALCELKLFASIFSLVESTGLEPVTLCL